MYKRQVLNVGVVTANSFFGDGSGLTGVANTENVIGTAITMTSGNITNLTGAAATFTGNVTVGGVLTYDDVTNVDSIGIVTARSDVRVGRNFNVTGISTFSSAATFNSTTNFNDNAAFGDDDVLNFGASSDGRIFFENSENEFHVRVPGGSGKLTLGAGAPVQITNEDGNTNRAVFDATGVRITGVCTATSFSGDGSALTGISVGLNTAAASVSGIVTTLDLSSAQDHKLTVSGISTITVKGGTEGDSHTVRIINSGITTVGFSTFFLFPSGADPSMPTADGAISLISFTVNRVGAGGTQLLAGAALNYS